MENETESPPITKNKMKGWAIMIIGILVIVALLGGVYYVASHGGMLSTFSSESGAKQAAAKTSSSLSDISNTLNGIQKDLG